VNDAFAAWLAEFVVTQEGCGILEQTDLSQLTAPDMCAGGKVEVTFAANDKCTSHSYSAYFEIVPAPAVAVSCPDPVILSTCSSYGDILIAYNNWVDGFTFTGGCPDAGDNKVSVPILPANVECAGASLEFTYSASDRCTDDECSSTFTVAPAPAVVLNVPANYLGEECMTQAAINADFAAWLAQVSFEGGCGSELTRIPENPVAPNFCGGVTTVTWTVTSDCEEPVVETRTFTIPDAPEVVLNVPDPYVGEACMDQDDVNAEFLAWFYQVSFSGGCDAFLTWNWITESGLEGNDDPDSGRSIIIPPPPPFCGGTTEVIWIVLSDCEEPVTKSSTFTIPDAPTVELTVSDNYLGTTCMDQEDINAEFIAWLAVADFDGGCGGELTMDPAEPEVPDYCGGETTVTWTVTSDCEEPVVKTRTFTIPDAPPVALTVPDNYVGETCLTQNEVDSEFNAWFNEAGFTGGCNATLSLTWIEDLGSKALNFQDQPDTPFHLKSTSILWWNHGSNLDCYK
jgi:hypothetical protein